ncbi:cysteine proteinase inhibitor 5-like [Tripterygium wilfordii]|uniref:Cysteine proteinase inhibitor 5-like n=1 Tax=Tripterygium wilfordii TaxID=458696 RepID=A0A7J7CQT2_TRIWF|nr:cysteine proteinase inhibitor B-like [Tripterygium wilfordii]KAF5736450.1 cysteine proteinase inhibitor 5-like [Tripterygium wilfordii]
MAALRRELYLVSVLVVISILGQVRGYRGHLVGGRSEVSDVKTNMEVQALGRFSVEEYSRLQHQHHEEENGDGSRKLTFTEVVEAQRQVVSGIKYYLKVLAMENEAIKLFKSVVVVKPWVHSKELIHFAPSTAGLELYTN